MMRCLGEIVSSTILSGNVWIDEIYFDVSKKDMISNFMNNMFLFPLILSLYLRRQ